MKRRLIVLLVFVSLLSGCGGGRTFDSIKKMVPVALLVTMVAIVSLAQDRHLKQPASR